MVSAPSRRSVTLLRGANRVLDVPHRGQFHVCIVNVTVSTNRLLKLIAGHIQVADCSEANGKTTSPPSVLPVLGGLVERQGVAFRVEYDYHPADGRAEWSKFDGRSLAAKCRHHGVHGIDLESDSAAGTALGLTLSARVVIVECDR